jgi:hypothetical protein
MIHRLLTFYWEGQLEYCTLVGETENDIEYLKECLVSDSVDAEYELEPISEREAVEIEEDNLLHRNARNRYQLYKGEVSNY